jgi:outer membrane immunogenic protein
MIGKSSAPARSGFAVGRHVVRRAAGVGFVIFSTYVAVVSSEAPAAAADLSLPAPPQQYNWTGLYLGAGVGFEGSTATANGTALAASASLPLQVSGVMGSAFAGYNWQIPGWSENSSVVVGLEIDGIGADQTGARSGTVGPETFAETLKVPVLGTFRARFGLPVGLYGAWLLYGTAGVGFGMFDSRASVSGPVVGLLNQSYSGAAWTIGGGVEYGLTRDWSLRAEYLFVDSGTITNQSPLLASNVSFRLSRVFENIARIGFGYHF